MGLMFPDVPCAFPRLVRFWARPCPCWEISCHLLGFHIARPAVAENSGAFGGSGSDPQWLLKGPYFSLVTVPCKRAHGLFYKSSAGMARNADFRWFGTLDRVLQIEADPWPALPPLGARTKTQVENSALSWAVPHESQHWNQEEDRGSSGSFRSGGAADSASPTPVCQSNLSTRKRPGMTWWPGLKINGGPTSGGSWALCRRFPSYDSRGAPENILQP